MERSIHNRILIQNICLICWSIFVKQTIQVILLFHRYKQLISLLNCFTKSGKVGSKVISHWQVYLVIWITIDLSDLYFKCVNCGSIRSTNGQLTDWSSFQALGQKLRILWTWYFRPRLLFFRNSTVLRPFKNMRYLYNFKDLYFRLIKKE